jgi:NodT family efflux transporter outer membrane factor (OMF) lipoprotein
MPELCKLLILNSQSHQESNPKGEISMKYICKTRFHIKPVITIRSLFILFFPIIAMGIILTGCATVGPDYVPVRPDGPEKWHAEMDGGLVPSQPDPEILARWWSIFNDHELSSLMERAIYGNLDLQTTRSRIREARAFRGISRASLFPDVDAVATAAKQRIRDTGGTAREIDFYTAGFDAGWEIDIFGGVQRSIEAAQADLEAFQENLHDVLISLMAEVALNYIEVRTYQARLTVVKANLKSQQETHDLNRSRYEAGIIDELALQESIRTLESSRSNIPALEIGLSAAQNRLAVLLGMPPGELSQELTEIKPIPTIPVTVAVGIPAETLRRRPDIKRAERFLAAQTARIGVATADLYPRFRLFGTIGLESIDSSDFFEWDSRFWSIGPSVSWRIFDAGSILQNIEVQSARQEQALFEYHATVLNAHEEVENALVAYAKEQQRRNALAKAVVAAQRAELLALDSYKAGLVGFFNVLDTQRSLLLLQDQVNQSDGVVVSNLVRLYKALGGGWDYASMAEPSSPTQ